MHANDKRRRRREGPEPAKRANTFDHGVAPQAGEGRSHVAPWCRPVTVVETSSDTQRGGAGLPVEQVSGLHVVRR